jgi:Protein of unknown function (DUF2946)
MRSGRSSRSYSDVRSPNRLLLIAFTILCLVLQVYAAQTHFHTSSELRGASVPHAQTMQVSLHGQKSRLPSTNDTDNCPLCQSLYNGQYVTPSHALYLLPILAVSIIDATSSVIPHYDAVSHSWRGRGPPHN